MISRLNFLLAVALLTVLLFYVAGRFLLLKAVLGFDPALAPYFTAAYGLGALMLTVLVLAKTVIRLVPISSAARVRRGGLRSLLAQAVLYAGHLLVIFAVGTILVTQGREMPSWPYLAAMLLYAAGIASAIVDWRQRASQAL